MTTLRFLASTSVLLSGGALISGACTTPATEIVAGMTTQIQVDKDLAAVGVVVRYGGQLVSCRSYLLDDGTVTLPSTLGVVPQDGREDEVLQPVTVTVVGFRTVEQGQAFDETCVAEIPKADAPEVVVIRSRRMPYTKESILYMPMPLRESCTGVVCGDEETCIGGKCESIDVDPGSVVDYKDSFVFGNTNTCFSVSRCLPGGVTQPAVLVDPATCTFKYPVPPGAEPPAVAPGQLNVEVVYHTMGTEVLDLDDKEGFVFPDENDPLTFRLAQNLCESNYQTGKIVGVVASPVCTAKRALQPICEGDLADIQSGSRSPRAGSGGGAEVELCTLGTPLVPTESALYVLLDRSNAMRELYGPEGLEFAINVPLENPVAARTQIGLSFLPAGMSACASTSIPPEVGFEDPLVVRNEIADRLADPATLLSDDPQLFLDAAMNGAYGALAALMPTESQTFNRRAVAIVGNRDLQQHCGASPGDPITLATDALANEGIYTYVAVLDAPAGAPQFGDDPQASAAAIATAGGTQVFDAIVDETEGALAVQKVLNDLGSCVYDPPSGNAATVASHLIFVDPVTLQRSDVARNDACNSEAAAVDGWGVESNGRIRICGAPCASLRTTLTNTAAYFAALGEPAPRVPIIAAVACADPGRFTE